MVAYKMPGVTLFNVFFACFKDKEKIRKQKR